MKIDHTTHPHKRTLAFTGATTTSGLPTTVHDLEVLGPRQPDDLDRAYLTSREDDERDLFDISPVTFKTSAGEAEPGFLYSIAPTSDPEKVAFAEAWAAEDFPSGAMTVRLR